MAKKLVIFLSLIIFYIFLSTSCDTPLPELPITPTNNTVQNPETPPNTTIDNLANLPTGRFARASVGTYIMDAALAGNTLFVVSSQKLGYTNDNGLTYHSYNFPEPFCDICVTYIEADGDNLYAQTSEGFLHSPDLGVTWNKPTVVVEGNELETSKTIDLLSALEQYQIVSYSDYANKTSIAISSDSGKSFSIFTPFYPTTETLRSYIFFKNISNEIMLAATTTENFYYYNFSNKKTTSSKKPGTVIDETLNGFLVGSENKIFAMIGKNIYQTADDGITWTNMNLPITATVNNWESPLFFSKNNDTYFFIYGMSLFTSKGTGSLSRVVTNDGPPSNYWSTVEAADGILTLSTLGAVCYTSDGGKTWIYPNFQAVEAAVAGGKIYLAATIGPKVSADGGKTWSDIDIQVGLESLSMIKADGKYIVYGINNSGKYNLIFSTDSGNTWKTSEFPQETYPYGYRIAGSRLYSTNSSKLFYFDLAAPENGITKLDCGSDSKSYLSIFGNELCVLFKDNTDYSICYSNDAGSTWGKAALAGIDASKISITAYYKGKLYVICNDGKLYLSTDKGQTWQLQSKYNSTAHTRLTFYKDIMIVCNESDTPYIYRLD